MSEEGQSFPIFLATPTAYWGSLCLCGAISSKVQCIFVLGFILSTIINESFASTQDHEDNLKSGTFLVKISFYAAKFHLAIVLITKSNFVI